MRQFHGTPRAKSRFRHSTISGIKLKNVQCLFADGCLKQGIAYVFEISKYTHWNSWIYTVLFNVLSRAFIGKKGMYSPNPYVCETEESSSVQPLGYFFQRGSQAAGRLVDNPATQCIRFFVNTTLLTWKLVWGIGAS